MHELTPSLGLSIRSIWDGRRKVTHFRTAPHGYTVASPPGPAYHLPPPHPACSSAANLPETQNLTNHHPSGDNLLSLLSTYRIKILLRLTYPKPSSHPVRQLYAQGARLWGGELDKKVTVTPSRSLRSIGARRTRRNQPAIN